MGSGKDGDSETQNKINRAVDTRQDAFTTKKNLNGADGYAEHSEEWEKCNTKCDFCKSE